MEKKHKNLYMILGIGLANLIIVILLFVFDISLKDFLNYTPSSLPLAAAILLLIYCIKVFAMFIPLALLFLAAGIMFPPPLAFLLTYLFLTVELILGFMVGKKQNSGNLRALIEKSKKGKQILEFGLENGLVSCFIIRMLPGPPVDLTSMFMGSVRFNFRQFMLGSLLGFTPTIIPLLLMGRAAENPLSPAFLVPFAIVAGTALVSLLIFQKMTKKNQQEKAERKES